MKHTSQIEAIMTEFAERTGLTTPAQPPRRYLWTDAFAVCNYLELFRRTGEEQYQQDAIHPSLKFTKSWEGIVRTTPVMDGSAAWTKNKGSGIRPEVA